MKPLTVLAPYLHDPSFEKTLLSLTSSSLVERVVLITEKPVPFKNDRCQVFVGKAMTSADTLRTVLADLRTKYLLVWLAPYPISIQPHFLERYLATAQCTKAGLVYSDFYDGNGYRKTLHPLIDYQPGSVRDDFDFGAMVLLSVEGIWKALRKHGPLPEVEFAGLYDLRLKLSIEHAIHHVPEPLYTVTKTGKPSMGETLFAYVDPRNRDVQKEMEKVFTDHLKRIGAYLPPDTLRHVERAEASFPVEASVVIPVRNRRETIAQAVRSGLSQETDFPFNVIVVDNHSTDGTTALLSDLAREDPRLRLIVPERTDLGIGGCWNEALRSEMCGRYAIQLDSDDLYSSPHSLQMMVDMLQQGNYAMVIGSYTLVDFELNEIPPGLVDHREWTDENGHNNALRINGLGAPRAFDTGLMREIGFLNVSYGEDYAAALRICREYRIGRIYESLYLCRRWPGNTDASLTIEERNERDIFKDKIRTDEILNRQRRAKS